MAAALAIGGTGVPAAFATVDSAGDVTPVPPTGGGTVTAPFRIGNTDLGTVSITGGTPLTATGGAAIGDAPSGNGILTMSGLGSDFTLANGSPLQVGNFGTGSLSVSDLAGLTATGTLFVAAQTNSSGYIDVSGPGTTFDLTQTAQIGQRGRAVVNVTAGARLQTGFAALGDQLGGDAQVTVSDPLSLWRSTSSINLAGVGRASLRVLNGARVENQHVLMAAGAGSTATVEVSGAGSTLINSSQLTVGEAGTASLVVADGGRVTAGGSPTAIGRQFQSRGDVEVRGAGSLLSGGSLTVAESGTATLRVLQGGRATSPSAMIGLGFNSRGEVLVDGVNSVWQIDNGLDVGQGGEAFLTVSNGGVVQTGSTSRIGTRGQLTLDGGRYRATSSGPFSNSGIIQGTGVVESTITNSGSGRIEVRTGDRLRVTGQLNNSGAINVLGGEAQFDGQVINSTSSGAITSRDGILRFGTGFGSTSAGGLMNNGSLAISFGTTDVFGDVNNTTSGRIVVSGGAQATFYDDVVNSGTITVSAAGTLKGTAVFFGSVSGGGSFPGGGTVFLEGDLRPGFSPGVLTFGGDLAMGPGSLLSIELADGAHDRVDVAGGLAAGGTMEVLLLDGFTPAPGERFDVLDFGNLDGRFATLNLPELPGGLQWDLANLYTDGTLAVVPEPGAAALLAVFATPALLRRRRERVGRTGSVR